MVQPEYDEDDFLMLSEFQHFVYCRRRWALIHIESQWAENALTVDGRIFHENVHDGRKVEKRGDIITMRDLHVRSFQYGIYGICDAVEFKADPSGISIPKYDGLWLPYPVEYKHGGSEACNADCFQLCGQVLCLEEMFACHIPEGALFYKQTKRREIVSISDDLRSEFAAAVKEMHEYKTRGYTPRVKPKKGCRSCSLKDICVPRLMKDRSVDAYLDGYAGGGV